MKNWGIENGMMGFLLWYDCLQMYSLKRQTLIISFNLDTVNFFWNLLQRLVYKEQKSFLRIPTMVWGR